MGLILSLTYVRKRAIGTYRMMPSTLDPYNSNSPIRVMCTYGVDPIQKCMMKDIESDPSVWIQFKYMKGFSEYRNRVLKST